ncbi:MULTISPECIES: WecB/TagA/CpsF family glycosyltransferase [Exiguobacterium]|uniref:WecB/TagA/CpsF family glycosyltransferase n=1 Tax=Exiguobacterium antarcticum TaxID=132920 RepID=A0ABT6R241_9BACL|nr:MULTISPECIES: WecB/TagA/CpsF family glycosyltransferase [Exiguobacterium]AFS71786.1 Glycosyl transferase, WecB/TagA/CpsF family [Exiguobacterium antarcticum B7]MCT4779550.1 WecB/TagA/CpsF family glycosyltransferase [Exiguobacterium soli]MDI3235009.1 WecB/TagA/CpsF family glycosyltransferase [Exiguobacterium antarcticum]
MIQTIQLFGLPFVNATPSTWYTHIKTLLHNNEKAFLVTANPELVLRSLRDPAYNRILRQATFITPDGIGVTAASKRMGEPLTATLPGIETARELLRTADTLQKRVFLLGGRPEVMKSLIKQLAIRFPDIQFVGTFHGFGKEAEAATALKAAQADLILVALGAPKQEQWIASVYDQVDHGLFIGVGGAFDVWSGHSKRAPKLFRTLKLEWLYRISSHPRGFEKLKDLLLFVLLVFRKKSHL